MALPQRSITLEQFLKLPEEEPALEFVAGTVQQKVSPKGPHGRGQASLARLISNFAEPRRLAAVFTETRVTYAGESRVPDLSVYRWDRVPLGPNQRVVDDFTSPPDIAVEIISPGQTRREQIERCRWYVEHDVAISLLVDPQRETVTRFRADDEPIVLSGDESIDLDPVLPGFRLSPNELFGALYFR
jgi:Uma2 family endonuclease